LRSFLIDKFNENIILDSRVQTLVQQLIATVCSPDRPLNALAAVGITWQSVAGELTHLYTNFRQFTFDLPSDLMYSDIWNWRCFMATILVCNTAEHAMLKVTEALFLEFPGPHDLLKLQNDSVQRAFWIDLMESHKIRHSKKKMFYLLNATSKMLTQHDGQVPDTRDELLALPGVGRHVSSVVLAWCHQKGEFGIDVHVKRILLRLELITPEMSDLEIESCVKAKIPSEKIGHFSRSFVDHGQTTCSFSPNCASCHLSVCCPYPAKHLEW
jgi:endonuclease-3